MIVGLARTSSDDTRVLKLTIVNLNDCVRFSIPFSRGCWRRAVAITRTYVVTVRGDAIFPSIQLVAGRRFRLGGDGCEPDRAGWRRSDISEHALGQRRR